MKRIKMKKLARYLLSLFKNDRCNGQEYYNRLEHRPKPKRGQ